MNNTLFNLYKNSEEFQSWPLKETVFLDTIYGKHKNDINNETKVIEYEINNEVIGFISCKVRDRKGVITFIFIKKEYRGNGIGTNLIKQSIDWFKTKGVKEIVFGAGSGSYIFPGLPKNLNIENFFKKNDFNVSDTGLVDMYQDITNWSADNNIFKKIYEKGIIIKYSNETVADKIIDFSKENFPNWYEYYKKDMEEKNFDKVFYAAIDNEIVGISNLWIGDCTWDLLFESNVGGGGALGVSEKHRGQGIGIAMKTWGTQRIKEKGIKYIWIGWTYAIDFYKKLGFKVWREYLKVKMSF